MNQANHTDAVKPRFGDVDDVAVAELVVLRHVVADEHCVEVQRDLLHAALSDQNRLSEVCPVEAVALSLRDQGKHAVAGFEDELAWAVRCAGDAGSKVAESNDVDRDLGIDEILGSLQRLINVALKLGRGFACGVHEAKQRDADGPI